LVPLRVSISGDAPMSTLTLQGMQPLFYSPLTMFEVDNAVDMNAQLLEEIADRQAQSPGLDRSNWRGWHSEDDFFERKEPGCLTLRGHILEAVRACTENVSPSFDFSRYGVQAEGWINVLSRGGLNTPHDHPGWVWSGCYYVSVPEGDKDKSGSIEFFDTRTNLRTLTVEGASCFASKFVAKPRSGLMFMFPSYLRHWVYPNESEEDRVSIAFNARFLRTART
jgi:uncharacterized protein (TIGR02466 family)